MSSRPVSRGFRRGPGSSTRALTIRRKPPLSQQLVLNSRRLRCPRDPPSTSQSISGQQWFGTAFSFSNSSQVVTPYSLSQALLPPCVERFRIQQFRIYGSALADHTIRLVVTDGDGKDMNDAGTSGSDRPGIAVEPCLSMRQRWYAVADASTILFTVDHDGVATDDGYYQILIDFRTSSKNVISP